MEGVRDTVITQVIREVIVESRADVPVHRFQFDKDQRQAVHETDHIRTTVVIRHADTLNLQFPHGEETVVGGLAKVDHLRPLAAHFARSLPPFDRDASTNKPVKFSVMLQERARRVDTGQLVDRLLMSRSRQIWIQPRHRRAQITYENHIALGLSAQRAGRSECFLVVGIEALPAEPVS